MIIGILGQLIGDRPSMAPGYQRPSPCGNGKTLTMVHFLYQEFIQRETPIITNFHTRHLGTEWGMPSWSTYLPSQKIFDQWFDIPDGTIIAITELMPITIPSIVKPERTLFARSAEDVS